MKLIDADKLMPLFVQMAYTIQDKHGVKIGENWLLNYDEIKKVIDDAPKVDLFCSYLSNGEVRQPCIESPCKHERPQGKWICDTRYLDCRCSICNSFPLDRGDYPELSPYCPQCGAKMEMPDEK